MGLREKIKKIYRFILLLKKRERNKLKIKKRVSKLLPKNSVIDIGASYFPHGKWEIFKESSNTDWLAIDPNINNLYYCDDWKFNSKIIKLPFAVSGEGGERKLYVTNVDSGSSLLEPVINNDISHRISFDYFFPIKTQNILTIGINDILEKNVGNNPFILKIDIQGTEFEILKSINKKYLDKILSIEMENNMQAQPVMNGTYPADIVLKFFNENNYELALITPEYGDYEHISKKLKSEFVLNECDFIYLLRYEQVIKRCLDECLFMLGVYFSYNLFLELKALTLYILENKNPNEEQKFMLNEILDVFKN